MKQTIWLALSLLATVCSVPALYAGMLLAGELRNFLFFPVPAVICVMIAAYTMRKAENL